MLSNFPGVELSPTRTGRVGRPRKSNDLCIRNVPPEVLHWIDHGRGQHYGGQQEFVLDVLKQACETARGQTSLPLDMAASSREVAGVGRGGAAFFNFIDIFAGIGGFRVALDRAGGRCVFSSEWDESCQRTYKNWHGETPHGDIREVAMSDIPDHDVLAAGFPCQPFSLAGVSKKNSLGREHGFRCATQGTLFFHLAEIIEAKRPPVLFLENVRNLLSHDKGQTWQTIFKTLEDLRYHVFHKVIDAAGWVPQHRERVYIVCFDRNEFPERPAFEFPAPPEGKKPVLADILEENVPDKYTLTDHLWDYLQRYAEKHRALGNGFGFGLASPDGIARTLSARYYKDGSEILIPQKGRNPRRLMPKEAARLMGFDDYTGRILVSDTQAYKQFGNAVVPKVVGAIAERIVTVLTGRHADRGNGCYMKRAAETATR